MVLCISLSLLQDVTPRGKRPYLHRSNIMPTSLPHADAPATPSISHTNTPHTPRSWTPYKQRWLLGPTSTATSPQTMTRLQTTLQRQAASQHPIIIISSSSSSSSSSMKRRCHSSRMSSCYKCPSRNSSPLLSPQKSLDYKRCHPT